MTITLVAVSVETADPSGLARFWAGVLGWELDLARADPRLLPHDDTGFELRFRAGTSVKVRPSQLHFDLTSAAAADQALTVGRALGLGARPVDVGQTPEEGHVVLADPAGNEFCVIAAGNNFLAGCGFLGAVSCDGSQALGYFWSRALGWPLVWDKDQETAIRSPRGGPKLTWGGVPRPPEAAQSRLRLEVTASDPGDLEHLVALGATHLDGGRFADPDGNEFRVQSPG